MKIHFKKLADNVSMPTFGRLGDAGADLVAMHIEKDETNNKIVCYTGIAVEIPEGMVGLIFPRSSIRNYDLSMANSVGVIDSGYRGEITVTFNVNVGRVIDEGDVTIQNDWLNPFGDDLAPSAILYNEGDRIAQLIIIPIPIIEYIEVDELSETERGTNGHGSTGN